MRCLFGCWSGGKSVWSRDVLVGHVKVFRVACSLTMLAQSCRASCIGPLFGARSVMEVFPHLLCSGWCGAAVID